MKIIEKDQLTANLLELLQLVEVEGEEILVTDGRKPVVKISQDKQPTTTAELFKELRGKVQYFEDITNATTEEWQ